MDECAVSGMCSQFCNNTIGSYFCACAEGYTLQQGSFCKANGEPAYLLLSDQHSIQKIPISDSGSLGPATILVHNLPQTLAIDIDIRYVCMYVCTYTAFTHYYYILLYILLNQWKRT